MIYTSKCIEDLAPNGNFMNNWENDQRSFNIKTISLVDENLAKKITNISFNDYEEDSEDEDETLYVYECTVETDEELTKAEFATLNKIGDKIFTILTFGFSNEDGTIINGKYVDELSDDDFNNMVLNKIRDNILNNDSDIDELDLLLYSELCDKNIKNYVKIKNGQYEYSDNLYKDLELYIRTKYPPVVKMIDYLKGLDSKVEQIIMEKDNLTIDEYCSSLFLDCIVDSILYKEDVVDSVEAIFEYESDVIPFIDNPELIMNCINQMTEDVENVL